MQSKLSRRRLLAGAGAAAAAAFTPLGVFSSAASASTDASGRLIPAGKMGTITFTQRDVPSRPGVRSGSPLFGYLGGPNFPQDPNDLGPLVPLPGGWLELFEFLAPLGFKQIEFAGYGQNAANPGGAQPNPAPGNVTTPESRAAYLAYARTLRGFLDDFGLEAIGNHGFVPNTWYGPNSAGGTMSTNDYNRLQTELEFASILGMPYMGTGGDPTDSNNRNIEAWTIAGEKWEAINRIAAQWGIHMYTHNHSPAYNFLQDGPMVTITVDRQGNPIAPTQVRAESGKRLMQHYLDVTSPDLCVIEMDIYWAHVAQHQWRARYDYDGNLVEDIFDPAAQVAKQTMRYALFHAKDGESRPDLTNGYNFIPFGDPRSAIDFETFYGTIGAKGYHNSNYEQDNAQSNTDRGQSLRHTIISAGGMANLRG